MQQNVYFAICPKQEPKMERVVPNRVGILGMFCPKQGQGFIPSAEPLHPNMCRVPSPAGGGRGG